MCLKRVFNRNYFFDFLDRGGLGGEGVRFRLGMRYDEKSAALALSSSCRSDLNFVVS